MTYVLIRGEWEREEKRIIIVVSDMIKENCSSADSIFWLHAKFLLFLNFLLPNLHRWWEYNAHCTRFLT